MFTFFYFIFIIFFVTFSFYKKKYLRKLCGSSQNLKVSIVIPAKDEEANIEDVLITTLSQNYKSDDFEVIVVNDRSTDKTKEIVESYLDKYDNLRLINIETKNKTLSGKQNALDVGIKNAKNNIIFITDADCVINRNWIRSVSRSFYKGDIALVVGKTEILESEKTFLYKYQVLSHRLLMEVAQVPIMYGFYTSGMGNNLAFKKSAYLEIGGYEALGDSILDDEILVRGFAKKGYGIAAAFTKNSVVKTKIMSNWRDLIKQHKRWVSGSLNIFTPSGFLTFIIYFINIYTVLLFCKLLIFKSGYEIIFKILGDFIIFSKLNRSEGRVLNIFDELGASIMSSFYLALIGTLGIFFPKNNWKDDKFNVFKTLKRGKV